jgi:hypothetical protein
MPAALHYRQQSTNCGRNIITGKLTPMSDSAANPWTTSIGANDALEGRLRRQLETLGIDAK